MSSPRSMPAAVSRQDCAQLIGELTMGYKVAVVGATGNVGRQMMEILAERSFPADEVVALASRRSLPRQVSHGDPTPKSQPLAHSAFSHPTTPPLPPASPPPHTHSPP